MPAETLHEPWKGFLHQIDGQLAGPTELHCLGGFVVAECYGLTRATADVDIIEVRGAADVQDLARIAGKSSKLAERFKVYVDIVTIAVVPDRYDERLVDVFAGEFRDLRLRAFEPHDLALAKLGRNLDHDREDVRRLALGPGLDVGLLRDRYRNELRYQFGNPAREDLTMELWVEMIVEVQAAATREGASGQ